MQNNGRVLFHITSSIDIIAKEKLLQGRTEGRVYAVADPNLKLGSGRNGIVEFRGSAAHLFHPHPHPWLSLWGLWKWRRGEWTAKRMGDIIWEHAEQVGANKLVVWDAQIKPLKGKNRALGWVRFLGRVVFVEPLSVVAIALIAVWTLLQSDLDTATGCIIIGVGAFLYAACIVTWFVLQGFVYTSLRKNLS